MAIKMAGHVIIEAQDLQKVIRDLQDTIKKYYVRKEDLQKMPTEMLLSKEQIEGLVKDAVDRVIARDYVPRDQYEKDIKELKDEIAKLRDKEIPEDPSVDEIMEGMRKIGLPDTSLHIVDHYDPAIHNEQDIVYTDRRGNQWMNGLPISEVISEHEVYHSPVYKSIDSAKEESKEESKHELTEFTQADLDAYSSRAFGSSTLNQNKSIGSFFIPSNQQAASTPSVDECRSKWDDLHKTLQSQWDDLGGNDGTK